MKIKKILSVFILTIIIFSVCFSTSVFAEAEKITWTVDTNDKPKMSDTELTNAEHGALRVFVYGYETKSGTTDAIYGSAFSTGLKEIYFATQNGDHKDVAVQRNGNSGAGSSDNFSVRYNWLHAAKYLVKFIQKDGHDYAWFSRKNDAEYIKVARDALDKVANNLGTFSGTHANAINEPSDNSGVLVRAGGAVQKITGKSTSEFEKQVRNAKREMAAAYDYKTGRSSYSNSEIDINHGYSTKMNYSRAQIEAYLEHYGERYNLQGQEKQNVKNKWEQVMGGNDAMQDAVDEYDDETSNTDSDEEYGRNYDETEPEKDDSKDINTKFNYPERILETGEEITGTSDVVNDAERFINDENSQNYLDTQNLQDFSQKLYGILLGIGIVIAVIIGLILGIKLMVAPVSQKAEAKKLLIPYAVGCAMVFGAFGIWKLVVTLMQEI